MTDRAPDGPCAPRATQVGGIPKRSPAPDVAIPHGARMTHPPLTPDETTVPAVMAH